MSRLALRVAAVQEGDSDLRLRIRVHGELVGSEASVLRHFMDGLSGRVPVLVELDLASVSRLDRLGLGVVVEAVERFRACGRPLVVVGGGVVPEGSARVPVSSTADGSRAGTGNPLDATRESLARSQSPRPSPSRGRCPSAEA
jgi:anti-anti-sigma regulatory factor